MGCARQIRTIFLLFFLSVGIVLAINLFNGDLDLDFNLDDLNFNLDDLDINLPVIIPGINHPDTPGGDIAIGQPVNDTLPTGEMDDWKFYAQQGDTVQISLIGGFDTYLELYDAEGQELGRDDDSGDGLNSLLCAQTLPYTGVYRIVVRAFRANADGGWYTLAVNPGTAAEMRQIEYGETITGSVGLCGGERFSFRGEAGDSIQIDMSIAGGDAYLILYDSDRREIERDDDGGDDRNARIRMTLERTDTYSIEARSYSSSSGGQYTLSLISP